MNKEKVDSIISEFKTAPEEKQDPCYQQINVRLSDDYKRKYEEKQLKSNNRLSKLIHALTKYAIDSF